MISKDIIKKVRKIEIKTRSIVNEIMSGEYHSAFKGSGMEFAEVRQYNEGDDIRTIDWNVTARAGRPFVKRYVEERELTVMLVVDASSSGQFGSFDKYKSEQAVEFCALLAFSAIKNNDRVGLIMFTSDVELYIPPQKGKKHVLRLIRELLYFKPRNRGTNINSALEFLNRVQKKKGVVFLVSDFFDTGYEQDLKITAKRHDTVAVSVYDRREFDIFDVGLVDFIDPETGKRIFVDTSSVRVREDFKTRSEKQREKTTKLLKKSSVDCIEIFSSEDYVEPLVKFFKKRERVLS